MTYHERMMDLPASAAAIGAGCVRCYCRGHADARRDAAEIAAEADAEIERLRKSLDLYREAATTSRTGFVDDDDICSGCGGIGWRTYGDTSTWRGGVGGQSLTDDVCCDCWGSGSASKHWHPHPRNPTRAEGDDA